MSRAPGWGQNGPRMRKNAGRGGFVDSKGRTEEDYIPTGHPVMHALMGGEQLMLFHKVYSRVYCNSCP